MLWKKSVSGRPAPVLADDFRGDLVTSSRVASYASALASAGTERVPSTSLAMSLSATAVIQAAPIDIPRMKSAAEATAQEDLVSMEADGIATSGGDLGVYTKFRHPMPSTGLLRVLLCAKMRDLRQMKTPFCRRSWANSGTA